MSLSNILILSVSVVLFVIGIHQLMIFGLAGSYWIFMLSVSLLLLYKYKGGEKETDSSSAAAPKNKNSKHKK